MPTYYGDIIPLPIIVVRASRLPNVRFELQTFDMNLVWNSTMQEYTTVKTERAPTEINPPVEPRDPKKEAPPVPPKTVTAIEAQGDPHMIGGVVAQSFVYTYADGSTESFTLYMKKVGSTLTYYYYQSGEGWRANTDLVSGSWTPSQPPVSIPPGGGGQN